MTFFEEQSRARRTSGLLVAAYVVAVILIALAVASLITVLWATVVASDMGVMINQGGFIFGDKWRWDVFGASMIGSLLIMVIATSAKIIMLNAGGAKVAATLGGRRILPDTRDPEERKVLNVVEEMAIASGMTVPPVYILEDEQSINAFAAGFTQRDAVIGVTRGTVHLLSRDELQGVIAHEFSHIHFGDMALNLRLMGLLHGILFIALTGRVAFRLIAHGGRGSRRSSRSGGGGHIMLVILVGALAMIAIGYIGVFFAKLIKSAVSRQREFLADASAVQFTRNPSGIGGALKKIGGFSTGSIIAHPRAEEASHLYFSSGLKSKLHGWFATHPPLIERVKKIDPHFSGTFKEVVWNQSEGAADIAAAAGVSGFSASQEAPAEVEAVVQTVGTVSPERLERARQRCAEVPMALLQLTRDAFGARALIHFLLLSHEESVRRMQLQALAQQTDGPTLRELQLLLEKDIQVQPADRVPLISLAIPALTLLSVRQYQAFRKNVEMLIRADEHCSIFEYTLQRLLMRHLYAHFEAPKPTRTRFASTTAAQPLAIELLCSLAYLSHAEAQSAAHAFHAALHAYGVASPPQAPSQPPLYRDAIRSFDSSLRSLDAAAPAVKERVLTSCVACITADKLVTTDERDLIWAVADGIGCPVPM